MMQQWFRDAKFGISLHWGIYAVNGIPESWSFFNGEISYEDYMKQCQEFTAKDYYPEQWADLFEKAGAKYVVLTAKHHDGVALWDTKYSDLNVVKKTPAGRDLIAPYCEAIRAKGLKVGFYFSHLDWSEPSYRSVYYQKDRSKETEFFSVYNTPPEGEANLDRWEQFLSFHRGQLRELMENYGPIDILCFDGDWEREPALWRMEEVRKMLHSINPNVVMNSRLCGQGDYETPEQSIPITKPEREWEFWFTINDSWGFRYDDRNYKSVRQLIRIFADCIGMGGNILLNVGPNKEGAIGKEETKRLLALGEWIRPNQEAIYGSVAGLPAGHFSGASTLSKNRENLYLFYFDRPLEALPVKGIQNKIKRISILKNDHELTYHKIGGADWIGVPGILWIDLPHREADDLATVIKVELDGPLNLYTGSGHAIQKN